MSAEVKRETHTNANSLQWSKAQKQRVHAHEPTSQPLEMVPPHSHPHESLAPCSCQLPMLDMFSTRNQSQGRIRLDEEEAGLPQIGKRHKRRGKLNGYGFAVKTDYSAPELTYSQRVRPHQVSQVLPLLNPRSRYDSHSLPPLKLTG